MPRENRYYPLIQLRFSLISLFFILYILRIFIVRDAFWIVVPVFDF